MASELQFPTYDGYMANTAEAPTQESSEATLFRLKRSIYEILRKRHAGSAEEPLESLRDDLKRTIAEVLAEHDLKLDQECSDDIVQMAIDDISEFGPISPHLRDGRVSDILVNGPYQIFVEINGTLQPVRWTFDDQPHLQRILKRLISTTERRIDPRCPMLDARLPDGSRVNAILNPPAINGPIISIRRFGARPLTIEDLLSNGTLTEEMIEFLGCCVRSRLNVVISGGTGSGKTTLLNALSKCIRPTERIATIEDTAELELQQPHVVKMEAIVADEDGQGGVSMRDLVRNTLRVRPDRIIIGECRGAEALEMLQAMNTGHEGSMTTIHANSPRDALSRIELMVGMSGIDIPLASLRRQMASSIDLIIQISRQVGGSRRVVSISEVTGTEGEMVSMHEVFRFVTKKIRNERTSGYFEATGNRPLCFDRLRATGAKLSSSLFEPRRLT